MLTVHYAHDALLGPAGRGHTPRLLQRLPLRDAARGGGGPCAGRLLILLLTTISTILYIHHSLFTPSAATADGLIRHNG